MQANRASWYQTVLCNMWPWQSQQVAGAVKLDLLSPWTAAINITSHSAMTSWASPPPLLQILNRRHSWFEYGWHRTERFHTFLLDTSLITLTSPGQPHSRIKICCFDGTCARSLPQRSMLVPWNTPARFLNRGPDLTEYFSPSHWLAIMRKE